MIVNPVEAGDVSSMGMRKSFGFDRTFFLFYVEMSVLQPFPSCAL
jgi:hypothetical protein